MKRDRYTAVRALVLMAIFCAAAMANPTWVDANGDSLKIDILPHGGQLWGGLGEYVGWGFNLEWSSSQGDWIQFTGSALTAQSQPGFIVRYLDFMGLNVGPDGGPSADMLGVQGPGWTQAYHLADPVLGIGTGVAAAQITTGVPVFADDHATLAFYFDLWSGQPDAGGAYLGSYQYTRAAAGNDPGTEVWITAVPEPGTATLLVLSSGAILAFARRRAA